jgi:hypothetical protein
LIPITPKSAQRLYSRCHISRLSRHHNSFSWL